MVIKIPFTGSPKPRITWQKDGENIESGGHYAVEVKVILLRSCPYAIKHIQSVGPQIPVKHKFIRYN